MYSTDTPDAMDSATQSTTVAIPALPNGHQQTSGSSVSQIKARQPELIELEQVYPEPQGSSQQAISGSVTQANTASSTTLANPNPGIALSSDNLPVSTTSELMTDDKPNDETSNEPEAPASIAGWVLNHSGEPVAGIKVMARAQRLFQGSGTEESHRKGGSQETRSDSEGRYAFHQLADGEYEIRSQPTALYQAARIIVRTGIDAADLILHKDYEFGIYGTVESVEGSTLEGVRVIPIGQTSRETTTTGNGDYRLTVATIGQRETTGLRFLLEGYREQRLIVRNMDATATGSIRLDARLEPATGFAIISGSVITPDHKPVDGATLLLSSAHLNRHYHVRSDSSGLFLFPEVEMGDDYRLRALASDSYRDYVQQDLVITRDNRNLLIMLEQRDNGRLEGWMSDPEGNPIPGFSLWLRNEGLPGLQPRLVTGDTGGYFSVDEVLIGALTFATRAEPSMLIRGIQLQADAQLKLQLRIDWGDHALYGQIVDSSGIPISQAKLSLSWSDDSGGLFSRSIRNASSDSGGYFLFTRLGGGSHQLHVSASGFRNAVLDYTIGDATEDILVMLEKDVF